MYLPQIRYYYVFALILGCVLTLTACGYRTTTPLPTAVPVPTPSPSPLSKAEATAATINTLADSQLKQIDQAEQRWKSQGIKNYRIRVKWFVDFWNRRLLEAVVRNNEITGQSVACLPSGYEKDGKCLDPGFTSASGATVDGLFSTARQQVLRSQEAKSRGGKNDLSILFDRLYGFPRDIEYKVLDVTDSDSLWEVELFEVLK